MGYYVAVRKERGTLCVGGFPRQSKGQSHLWQCVECSIMLVTGEERNPIMYLTQHRGYREISYTGRLGREGWVAGDIDQQRRLCRLSFYNLFRKIQVGNE